MHGVTMKSDIPFSYTTECVFFLPNHRDQISDRNFQYRYQLHNLFFLRYILMLSAIYVYVIQMMSSLDAIQPKCSTLLCHAMHAIFQPISRLLDLTSSRYSAKCGIAEHISLLNAKIKISRWPTCVKIPVS